MTYLDNDIWDIEWYELAAWRGYYLNGMTFYEISQLIDAPLRVVTNLIKDSIGKIKS